MTYADDIGALIGVGVNAEVFELGDGEVLKLFFPEHSAEEAEREAKAHEAAWTRGIPSPRISEIVTVCGRAGIVMERIDGVTMLHGAAQKPWLIGANAGLLARLHLDVHARSDTGLPPFRDWLESYIRRATGLDEGIRLRALRRLERLEDGTSLCHGDFHPDNVVMTNRGPVIIDWAAGATGPPEADVARTIMLLESGEPIASGLERLAIAVGRRVFLALYLRAYFKSSNLTRRDVDPWMLPISVARYAELAPERRERFMGYLQRWL